MLFLSELVLDFQCLYFEICEIVPIRLATPDGPIKN